MKTVAIFVARFLNKNGINSNSYLLFGFRVFLEYLVYYLELIIIQAMLQVSCPWQFRKEFQYESVFITLAPASQCDGKHVVFGRVLSGWKVLRVAEAFGTASGAPTATIDITDFGVFTPVQTPSAGYWYVQPDPDSFSGTTPVFMVRPRVAVVAPNAAVADKFGKALGTHCSVVNVLLPPEQNKTESESETDEAALVDRVGVLLENFIVDVVLVTPALKHLVPRVRLDPSSSWATDSTAEPIPASEVILEAKPVEAMATIRTQSWLAKRTTSWQLDGM
jgi:hypothetical protein